MKMFWGTFMTGAEDNFFTVKDSFWLNDTFFDDGISGVEIREVAQQVVNLLEEEMMTPSESVSSHIKSGLELIKKANLTHSKVMASIQKEGEVPKSIKSSILYE